MNRTCFNWQDALKGYVLCKFCGDPIHWIGLVNWVHDTNACGYYPIIPLLHRLSVWDIERMGISHGRMGASITDNPYGAGGPLFDGADSCGEAATWHNGWEIAQREMGKPSYVKENIVVKTDDLDYLELERE